MISAAIPFVYFGSTVTLISTPFASLDRNKLNTAKTLEKIDHREMSAKCPPTHMYRLKPKAMLSQRV